ncbi:MAG: response regulator transcription factor [Thermodesulfovibrionales bacterium]|nr:response regulator transcription factor [Thermodesulfovibrionales bacterium]
MDQAKAELMAPYLAKALEKNMISHKMIEQKSFIDSIVASLPYKGIMVMDASLDPIYQDENAVRIMSNLNKTRKPGETSFKPLPEEIYLRCRGLLSSAQQENISEPRQHQFDLVPPGGEQKVSVHLRLITQRGKNPLLLLCLNPEKRLLSLSKQSNKYGLTRREIEVVSLLSEGLTNKRIGRKLFISEYTVENHLRSIYRKVGVKNRTSLVHRLIQQTSTDNWLTHSSLLN